MVAKCRRMIILVLGLGMFSLSTWSTWFTTTGLHFFQSGAHDGRSRQLKKHSKDYMLQYLSLTEHECAQEFPGLDKEVSSSVARGRFELKRSPDDYTGLVQGRIRNQKLYIISIARDTASEVIQYRSAILHSLYRAIITAPTPLPDIYFSLCLSDYPRANSWSFSRDPSVDANHWLMPHFGGWSWPLPFVGPLDEALTKIEEIEGSTRWEKKIDKAVWRGTGHFNPLGNKELRSSLVDIAKGKEWADVEMLKWIDGGKNASNALHIEEFCKYKYIIYTEGVTYSGRLLYHQLCNSIILTPPPVFLQHTSHLIRPLFSSSLGFPSQSYLTKKNNITWPHHYSSSEANAVFVSPDWADLEQTINYLRKHPKIARGIADRQRKVMSRYLSPAAESCYWRYLIRGWDDATRAKGKDDQWGEGIRWETFAVTGKLALH